MTVTSKTPSRSQTKKSTILKFCTNTLVNLFRFAAVSPDPDEIDALSVVIAGRAATAARVDPAIHLLRKDSMRNRWTPGSSPGGDECECASATGSAGQADAEPR